MKINKSKSKILLLLSLIVLLSSSTTLENARDVYAVPTLNLEVVLIAGGGGGAGGHQTSTGGSGGGAGEYYHNATYIGTETTYTVTIGAGGLGGETSECSCNGNTGSNSVFGDVTVIGGGAGKYGTGGSGGSGGGGYSSAGVATNSTGIGHNGGYGDSSAGSGGGGAGGVGGNASGNSAGGGGASVTEPIEDELLGYGGGGRRNVYGGSQGGVNSANGGNGGGGGSGGAPYTGGGGEKGLAKIKYLTAGGTATGGTISYDGLYTIHTFSSSGTFEITEIIPPSLQTLTLNLFENDGSTALDGSVLIANSTWSDTYSTSSGVATVPNMKLNDSLNMTVFDSNNIIGNTTLNYLLDGNNTESITTDIFRTSCGSGDDVLINLNETNAHYITQMSTPECSTQTVTFNATFTKLGNSVQSTNFTSILYATVLDTTNYLADFTSLLVNGTSVGTTFSTPDVFSSAFDIANGTTSVFLNFSFIMGDTPATPAPSGGGGGGGGGSSGGGASSTSNVISEVGDSLIALTFLPNSHLMTVSDFTSSIIPITWNNDQQIRIDSMSWDNSELDSIKLVIEDSIPQTLLPLDSGDINTSTNEIAYSITTPDNICNPTSSDPSKRIVTNCMQQKLYSIPITITAIQAGEEMVSVVTITVDTRLGLGGSSLALISVMIMAMIGIAGIIQYTRHRRHSSKPRNHSKSTHHSAKSKSPRHSSSHRNHLA